MRKLLGIVLVALLVLPVAVAWADEIQGKIQSVDLSDRAFTLEDGTRLWVAEGLSMYTLREGSSVKASYEERDGKKVVTGFEVSP